MTYKYNISPWTSECVAENICGHFLVLLIVQDEIILHGNDQD